MGFRDVILGRSKPPKPNLDALFALTNAALTLEAAMDLRMTGRGAVCFRGAEGPAFRQALAGVVELLDNDDDPDLERSTDSFGFTWLLAQQADMSSLVTDLHAINTTLEMQGFSEVCSARWSPSATQVAARWGSSTSTSRAHSTRSPRWGSGDATTCSRSRCGTCWPATCRSSGTCRAGWRCGEPPASDPPTGPAPSGWGRAIARPQPDEARAARGAGSARRGVSGRGGRASAAGPPGRSARCRGRRGSR